MASGEGRVGGARGEGARGELMQRAAVDLPDKRGMMTTRMKRDRLKERDTGTPLQWHVVTSPSAQCHWELGSP